MLCFGNMKKCWKLLFYSLKPIGRPETSVPHSLRLDDLICLRPQAVGGYEVSTLMRVWKIVPCTIQSESSRYHIARYFPQGLDEPSYPFATG